MGGEVGCRVNFGALFPEVTSSLGGDNSNSMPSAHKEHNCYPDECLIGQSSSKTEGIPVALVS